MTRRSKAVPTKYGLSATPALLAGGIAMVAMAVLLVAEGRGASAVPSTLYVNKGASNCSDTGSGTQNQPYCTIKKAATVAVAGQTVLVSSGTYGGDVVFSNSGTSSARIVFQEATGANVIVSGGTNGFKVGTKSYITIKGFTVTQSTGIGIYVKASSNIIVDSNDVSFSGQRTSGNTEPGIRLDSTSNSLVTGNVTHDNSDHGIHLVSGATGNEIAYNVSYNNARGVSRAAEGIFLHSAPSNSIHNNISHDNEDSGIGLWNSSDNNTVFDNVIYKNGDHGIDNLTSVGEKIVSNTVFKNVDSGIELQTNAGADLSNNISVDNGINSPRTKGNIRVVDSGSAAQMTMDYNVLFLSADNDLIDYLGVKYTTLASFQAAKGKELHGKQADPKFANSASGDFHLLTNSPAIDSANSGAVGQPPTDFDGRARVDDPLTTNTGVGPRTYDDRGAFEYVPNGDRPPVAVNDSAATNKNVAVTVTVLANDTDPDNDPLTVTGASAPAHGTTVVNANNTVTYTPAANYVGPDSFTYTISDGRGGTATATVSITVNSVNAAPVATAQSVSLAEDTTSTVTLTGTDADNDPLRFKVTSLPANGKLYDGTGTAGHLIVAGDLPYALTGSFNQATYQPNANYFGSDSFQFKANDGQVDSAAAATVSLTVTAVNDPPVATAQSASLAEDTTSTVTLTGTDADNDPLRFKVTSLPANGNLYDGTGTAGHLIVAGDLPYALTGSFNKATYQPNANYFGSDSFQFKANDGQVDSAAAATVSLTVTAVNDPPVATAQSVTLNQDTTSTVTLAGTDPDSDPLHFKVTSLPANGKLYDGTGTGGHLIVAGDLPYVLTGTFNQATYQPNAGYFGPDSFQFKANDGQVDSAAAATVSITVSHVNHAPSATAQSVTLNQDTTSTVTLAGTDPDSDPLRFKVTSLPANGKLYDGTGTGGHLIVAGDLPYALTGTFNQATYQPNAGYFGPDSFQFKANDGQLDSAAAATVSITVSHVNHAPVATAQSVTLNQDTTSTVTLAGTDPDSDPLRFKVTSLPANGKLYDGTGTGGHLIVAGDLPYALTGTFNQATYQPNAGYFGPDSFQFKANDGQLDSAAAATVSITVSHVNHAPVATAQSVTLNQDTTSTVTLTGTDPDSDPLRFKVTSLPANGKLYDGTGTGGHLIVAGDLPYALTGTFNQATYQPNAGYFGPDSFQFKANDGQLDSAAAATVSVTVNHVNHAPTANSDSASTPQNTAVTVSVLANDTDPDNDLLTVTGVSPPAQGTAVVNGGTTITYTPTSGYSGPDSFTYTISDGNGGTASASVSITVNDPPVANAQSVTLNQDTAGAVTLTGSDPNNDPLRFKVTSLPANGKLYDGTGTGGHLILAGELPYALTGTFNKATYQPTAGYFGPDSFQFKANDGQVDSTAAATVSITVNHVNHAPVANNDSASTPSNTPVTVNVLGNDTDSDNDTLTVTSVSLPSHGVATVNLDNTVTYAPLLGYSGPDSFTYDVSDGNGGTATATVSVLVNDPPVANAQSVSLTMDTTSTVTLTGSDPNNDPLSFKVTSLPAHGKLYDGTGTGGHLIVAGDLPYALTGTGDTATYQPNTGYSGPDSFQFKANDGHVDSVAAATVSISVDHVNHPPVANDDSASTPQNTAVTVSVLANDTDSDNDLLTVTGASTPAHGSTVVNAGATVTYTPTAGYSGPDSFTYDVSDGNGGTASATVSIIVNDPPTATAQSVTLNQDTTSTVTLTGSDPNNDPLYFKVTSLPAHGKLYDGTGTGGHLIVAGDLPYALTGTFNQATYQPNAGYFGPDSFQFKANDGQVDSAAAATVSITVNHVNHPPVANNDSAATSQNTPVTVSVLANDSDPDNDTLTVSGASTPAHGTTVVNGDNTVTYTPTTGYSGPDSFTYDVSDGNGGTASATVSITVNFVNHAPSATAQSVTLNQDTTSTVTLAGTDPDSDPLRFKVTSLPANGKLYDGTGTGGHLIVAGDLPYALTGTFNQATYQPNAGYFGPDSFQFKANDGQVDSAAAATVSITVSHVNHAPTATAQSVTLNQDTTSTVTLAGTDPDSDPLRFKVTSLPANGKLYDGTGTGGHLIVAGDLPYALTGTFNQATYQPNAGYFGPDSFQFKANDGQVDSAAAATVSITVSHVNHAPSATAQSVTLNQDTTSTVTLAGTDPDSDPLRFKVTSLPANGKLYDGTGTGGHLIVAGDLPYALTGTFNQATYQPNAGYFGPDSFQFKANDGQLDSAAAATVSITVSHVNHPPVANDDSASTSPNTPVTVSVRANDTDPDNDLLTVTGASTPAHGSTVVNGGATVTYTPASGYSGPDSFTYTISDGNGGTASATVSITVNSAPNLITNPGFETDTSGWTAGATFNTLTRVAGGHTGGWAAQLSNSTAGSQCTLDDKPNSVAVTQSGPYTARIWARSDTAGMSFKLRIREFNGGTSIGSVNTTVTLTSSWQQVTVVYTPVSPGTSNLDVQAYTTSSPVGVCFQADDVTLTH